MEEFVNLNYENSSNDMYEVVVEYLKLNNKFKKSKQLKGGI
jgi:hypothetical protein